MAKRTPIIRVERGGSVEQIIFRGSTKPLTEPQLHRSLDPIIRTWLEAAFAWNGDEFGDYRFLIFGMEPAPGVMVYVQLWSEPGELVLCEVSSGRGHRPTEKWLEGPRSKAIELYDFAIGGEADNFQRQFVVDTPKDVADLAALISAIFFNAFDYRGETSIGVKLSHDGRAEARLVYDGFTTREIMEVFAANGFVVDMALNEDKTPVFPPLLHCTKRGITTVVELLDLIEDDETYGRMHLSAEIPLSKTVVAEMREREGAPSDAVPIAVVSALHSFFGGVTLEWVIERVQEWDEGLAEHKREVGKKRKEPPQRSRRPPRETVH